MQFFFFFANYSTVPHSCLKFVTWTDREMIFSWFALLVTQLQLATVASFLFSLEANVPVHKVWSFKSPLLYFVSK